MSASSRGDKQSREPHRETYGRTEEVTMCYLRRSSTAVTEDDKSWQKKWLELAPSWLSSSTERTSLCPRCSTHCACVVDGRRPDSIRDFICACIMRASHRRHDEYRLPQHSQIDSRPGKSVPVQFSYYSFTVINSQSSVLKTIFHSQITVVKVTQ